MEVRKRVGGGVGGGGGRGVVQVRTAGCHGHHRHRRQCVDGATSSSFIVIADPF